MLVRAAERDIKGGGKTAFLHKHVRNARKPLDILTAALEGRHLGLTSSNKDTRRVYADAQLLERAIQYLIDKQHVSSHRE